MALTTEMANRKIETYNHLAQGFAVLARITSDAYYDQFDTHYMTCVPAITAPVVVSEGHPVLPIADIPPEEELASTDTGVCGEEKSSKNTSRKDVETSQDSAGTVKKCSTKHSQAANKAKKNTVLGETSTLESFVSTAQEVSQDSIDSAGTVKKPSTKHSQAANTPEKNTVLGETSTLESFVSTAQEVSQDSIDSEKHVLGVSGESEKTSTPSLVEVRGILAELSRAGYTAEVRNLIVSLGFEKLSEIPAELYPQVLAKAEVIGHA